MQKFKMATKKWRENEFGKKWQITLQIPWWVKILLKLLARFPLLNAFLHFTQKFKMEAKHGREMMFGQKFADDSAETLGVRNFIEITLSHTVSEI